MRLALLLFVGTLAVLVSGGAVSGSILVRFGGGSDKLIESVGGIAGCLLWALFGLGAMNVEQVAENGEVLHSSEPMLAFMAAGFAALMLLVALFGTLPLVDVSDVRISQ